MNWHPVVAQIAPSLLRYFSSSFTRAIADELVQETLIRLVRKVESGQYDSRKSSMLAFSYGIARFVRLEALKALPREFSEADISDESVATTPLPDEIIEFNNQIRSLRKALATLPDLQREILVFVLDRDLTLPEIAEILEIPVGTVKSHVHRAKDSLSEIMKKEVRK